MGKINKIAAFILSVFLLSYHATNNESFSMEVKQPENITEDDKPVVIEVSANKETFFYHLSF